VSRQWNKTQSYESYMKEMTVSYDQLLSSDSWHYDEWV